MKISKGLEILIGGVEEKRYGKTMDAKTIKYELCVMIDMYFGHEPNRDDGLYYSIHWKLQRIYLVEIIESIWT